MMFLAGVLFFWTVCSLCVFAIFWWTTVREPQFLISKIDPPEEGDIDDIAASSLDIHSLGVSIVANAIGSEVPLWLQEPRAEQLRKIQTHANRK